MNIYVFIHIPQDCAYDQFLIRIKHASRVTRKTSVTPEVKASKSLPTALLRTRRKDVCRSPASSSTDQILTVVMTFPFLQIVPFH